MCRFFDIVTFQNRSIFSAEFSVAQDFRRSPKVCWRGNGPNQRTDAGRCLFLISDCVYNLSCSHNRYHHYFLIPAICWIWIFTRPFHRILSFQNFSSWTYLILFICTFCFISSFYQFLGSSHRSFPLIFICINLLRNYSPCIIFACPYQNNVNFSALAL